MPVLLLLFGGRSGEHSVSCASANAWLANLPEEWEAIPVGITRDGAFVSCESPLPSGMTAQVEDNDTRVIWPSRAGERAIEIVTGETRVRREFDLVFPLFHGPFGEDGTIQGMLELLDLPYVGSGVFASAVGMSKHYTKIICRHYGVPVLDWELITRFEWENDPAAALERAAALGAPLFIKPDDSGSSLGCHRLDQVNSANLSAAIEDALQHGTAVMVEPAVSDPEIFCSVLGRPGDCRVSEPVLLNHQGKDFYDYQAKYLRPLEFIIPAPVPNIDNYAELAQRAFTALNCRGYARIDFFATENGLVFNEVNTSPGLTAQSIFSSSWRPLNYRQVAREILSEALAGYAG